MTRYILRRLLQAVPTIFGVVLITFVLFHVVGGSPAAMVLGQNADARSLEEFDEVRGYNKPLFFGRWTPTRALEEVDFRQAPPGVRRRWGLGGEGPLRLAESEALQIPLAFPLPKGGTWRVTVRGTGAGFPQSGKFFSTLWKKNDSSLRTWRQVVRPAEMAAEEVEAVLRPGFRAGSGGAEILQVCLERGTRHGFDSQLWAYIQRVARLDFGTSTSLNRPVLQLLKAGVGPSLALTVPILVIELVVSLTLALLCAYRRGSWLDRSLVAVCVALMSINYLVWIVFGQFVLAYTWGWFPVWGFESWRNLLLPVLIGVATGLGVNVRFYRTLLLEEMHKDYVRTAVAKGLGKGRVLFKHVLKNALGPVITNVALALPFLYTGSLLLESFFGIPGLGYLSLNAIHSSDVDVVRAVVLVGALLFTVTNVLADVAMAWVDPRVKLS
ncbi:MAG: ABC transporter permease [Verrucomicrobiota bacterium]|nr:ABC transporter permease [Verrucomicrobiota bacterium]